MNLEFTAEPGYLRVAVTGTRNLENVLAVAEQTARKCMELGILRALVDVREMRGGLSTFESHQLSAHELTRLRDQTQFNRAAVIDLTENQIRFSFLEQVAQSRGIGLRFFCEEAAAREWLLEEGTTL